MISREEFVPVTRESSGPSKGYDLSSKIVGKKWGESLQAGFQIVPDVLIRCQRLLGLESADIVILLNITLHWWEYDNLPHPRPSVIARRMNMSTRTVERRIVALQKKGLITRLPSRLKNGKTIRPYDLSGLVESLKSFSSRNLGRRNAGEVRL